GSFALDAGNERLWRGAELVPLRPKPFLLLRYLLEHADRVVSKPELLRALWPDAVVSAGVLKGYIHDLRTVLRDDLHAPQFIATVGRRGYRFIASVTVTAAKALPKERHEDTASVTGSPWVPEPQTTGPPLLVGREAELRQLQGWLEQALRGK